MEPKFPDNPFETTWDDLPDFLSYHAVKDAFNLGLEVVTPENLRRLQKKDDEFFWSRMFKVNGQDCIMRISFSIVGEESEAGDDFRPDA